MKLTSLFLENDGINNINELLNIDGSIQQIIIISGYIDLNLVDELIKYLRKNHDGRIYPILKIYTDSFKSGFFSNNDIEKEFKTLAQKINKFCSEDSGIYLVRSGKLFHSKCFIIKSTIYQKFIIGSLNFTRKGLTENEELILSGTSEISKRTSISKLITWIYDNYLIRLEHEDNSTRVTKNSKTKLSPIYLRHMLLEGNMYYELTENDPFRFKLRLPEELTDVDAKLIHPLLDGSIKDSISIATLIERNMNQGGLGINLPQKPRGGASWKKYCVETCYGYWNPYFYIDEIKKVIEKRKDKRLPHYEKIRELLEKEKDKIFEKFNVFIVMLYEYIKKNHPGINWEFYMNGKIYTNWENWYENLSTKLEKTEDSENSEYFNRLVSGISSVTVPDVWDDPVASSEFEESFLESIIYYWSKEYSKETTNKIAQSISEKLELTDEEKDNIEIQTLKIRLEEWIFKNKGCELFNDEFEFE